MVEWRGKLLVFGGFYRARADVAAVFANDAWLFSPQHNAWRELRFSARPGVARGAGGSLGARRGKRRLDARRGVEATSRDATAPQVARPPVRSGCVLAAGTGNTALVWGGYSEVTCDNMVKAKGKEHADAWRLTIADPFEDSKAESAWERLPLKGDAPQLRCGAAVCVGVCPRRASRNGASPRRASRPSVAGGHAPGRHARLRRRARRRRRRPLDGVDVLRRPARSGPRGSPSTRAEVSE